MTTLEQYLTRVREVAKLALENRSDEEIAKEMGMNVYSVAKLRTGMGITKLVRKDIFNGTDTKAVNWYEKNSNPIVHFTIPRHLIEDLGMNTKLDYVVSAKILGKGKVELTIKPSI